MSSGVDAFFDWGGQVLLNFRPHFPSDIPISSTPPSWYITPRQTFVELVFWNIFFWGALIYMLKFTGFPKPLELPRARTRTLSAYDWTLGAVLVLTLAWVVWYKYVTGTFVYLFQPCHIVSAMLIYLCLCTDYRKGSLMFAVFTHVNVGTLLAIGFPDTRDYYRRAYYPEFTVANFFVLHYLLALLPLYYEWSGIFKFRKSLYANVFGWILLGVFHWSILLPVSIVAENNLNYIMSPPPKGPLIRLGVMYRSAQTVATLPMVMVPGLLFPFIIRVLKTVLGAKSAIKPSPLRKSSRTTK